MQETTLPTWFVQADADAAFGLDFPPIEFELTYSPEPYDGIKVQLYGWHNEEQVVLAQRRIATVDDQRLAFHDVFLISGERGFQKRGLATQMLAKCLPYYRTLGIRYVIIPETMPDGRKVWPKFGFVLLDELKQIYVEGVMDVYARKTGDALEPGSIPTGCDFHPFGLPLVTSLSTIALIEMEEVGYSLDLENGETVECLSRRNIKV
jgi:GNAT superfamily N-acetyltransferase